MATNRSRYPGLAPFTGEDQKVFFGRTRELASLLRLVEEKNQVLLYSKSGIGKSSLLDAGLAEKLKSEKNTSCTIIRFGNYGSGESTSSDATESPLENLAVKIGNSDQPTLLSKLIPDDHSLWARLKMQQTEIPVRHILIFDQFEQLFTYPDPQIQEFKLALAELLNPHIPDRFQKKLQDLQDAGQNPLSEEEMFRLYDPFNIRIVVAIREDRMSHILQLNDYLPDLRHNFFELKPLDRERAREAITKPADAPGIFTSLPFTYEKEAVDAILHYLSDGDRQPIETTQLQIICQQVESIRKAWTTETPPVFSEAQLPKFQNVLCDFYLSVLQKVPADRRIAARRFIEEKMIYGTQRIPVAEQTCQDELTPEVLKMLVEQRLLRPEDSSTGRSTYELSHDTWVDSILPMKLERQAQEKVEEETRLAREVEDKQKREAQLALEKAEREKEEREEKIKEQEVAIAREQRQLRRTRMMVLALLVAVVGLLIAVAAFIFAMDQKQEAKMSSQTAKIKEAEAVVARAEAEERLREKETAEKARLEGEVNILKSKAEAFMRYGEKQIALETLAKALEMDSTRADIKELIIKWK